MNYERVWILVAQQPATEFELKFDLTVVTLVQKEGLVGYGRHDSHIAFLNTFVNRLNSHPKAAKDSSTLMQMPGGKQGRKVKLCVAVRWLIAFRSNTGSQVSQVDPLRIP